MTHWKFFAGDKSEWDELLAQRNFLSLYQSYEWGQIKSQDGWQVVRFLQWKNQETVVGMAQVLMKRLPLNVAFFWCPGGPLSETPDLDFREFRKDLNFGMFYFRASFHDPNLGLKELKSEGWRRPRVAINSNLSMSLDLTLESEDLRKNLSSNWRHNLKRFEKKKIHVEPWASPDPKTLFDSYQEFEEMKNLSAQHSLKSIEGVIREYQDRLVILRALDEEGDLLALRGYIYSGRKALDWYAISTAKQSRHCYWSLRWHRRIRISEISGKRCVGGPGCPHGRPSRGFGSGYPEQWW